MDLISPPTPTAKGAGQVERTQQGKGGEAFASLLQEIFAARMTPPQVGKAPEKAVPGSIHDVGKSPAALFPENSGPRADMAGAPAAVQGESDKSSALPGEYGEDLPARPAEEPGQGEQALPVLATWLFQALLGPQGTAEKGALEGLTPHRLEQLLTGILNERGEQKENLPAELLKMMEHNVLTTDELLHLEQRPVAGELPLVDEKGFLTPQAGAVVSSYLLDDEVLLGKLQMFFSEAAGENVEEEAPQFTGAGSNSGNNISLKPEEILFLEKQLSSGEIPFVDAKGSLTPEAGALLSLYQQEGRTPDKLPPEILAELREIKDGELFLAPPPAVDLAAEKQPAPFLDRLEQFLRSLLLGDNQAPGGEKSGEKSGDLSSQKTDLAGKPGRGGEIFFSPDSRTEGTATLQQAAQRDILLQPREIVNQVIEKLTLLARPGEQELRMKLQPEFLGEILIRMRNVRGILSAEILTQNIAVKELLESQMDVLRQRFQEMNMNVEEFRVLLTNEREGGNGGMARQQYRESEPDGYAAGSAYHKDEGSPSHSYEETRRVNYLA